MALTIRLLEHTFADAGLKKTETIVSVLERTDAALVQASALPGTKRVFDIEGVKSRQEAGAVLKLSRQAQPDQSADPEGWGSVQAFKNRVSEVPLPAAPGPTNAVTLKGLVKTAQEG